MATTLRQISEFLTKRELKHKVVEDKNLVRTGIQTDNYVDEDGEKGIPIIIKLDEDGEYLKVFTPSCYKYPPDGPNRDAVFQACLMVSWMTKSIQFEYDVKDGEIRCTIEFPLEDALLTERQLMRCITTIVTLVDDYDEMIRGAITTGTINVPVEAYPEEMMAVFVEFMKNRMTKGRPASGSSGIELEE